MWQKVLELINDLHSNGFLLFFERKDLMGVYVKTDTRQSQQDLRSDPVSIENRVLIIGFGNLFDGWLETFTDLALA